MTAFSFFTAVLVMAGALGVANADHYLTSSFFQTNWAVSCSTNFGTALADIVPTATTTVYASSLAMQVNSTSSPTSTVTPAVVTTTSTLYTTTTATVSGLEDVEIFSTTSTIYKDTTSTVTTTWTVTTCSWTTTTLTETTTVPIPSDFRLVGSAATPTPTSTTAGSPYYGSRKRQAEVIARQVAQSSSTPNATLAAFQPQNTSADLCQSEQQYSYPQCVECLMNVEEATTLIYIDLVPATTTTLCPKTTTTSFLSTVTTTSSLPPQTCYHTSSYWSTITTTCIHTTQVTTTTTSMETATATTTVTEYAACGTGNVLGPTAGASNSYVASANIAGALVYHDTAASAYDCCVLCQTRDNCAVAVFGTNSTGSQCNLAMVDTCTSQSAHNGTFLTQTYPADSAYFLSNGHCGYLENGGSA